VLAAAAVLGRAFDIKLVGPASELPDDRVMESLSEAVALGVVSEDLELAPIVSRTPSCRR
jgi:hypothetical protein